MRLWLSVLFAVLSWGLTAGAQEAATTHIFPQVADGRQSDGMSYFSRIWAMSLGGPAACTLSLYGLDTGRLSSSQNIHRSRWRVDGCGHAGSGPAWGRLRQDRLLSASGRQPHLPAPGPRRDDCGHATVYSSPVSSYAMLPMLLGGSARYGIALANDTDVPAFVNLFLHRSRFGKFECRGPSDSAAIAVQRFHRPNPRFAGPREGHPRSRSCWNGCGRLSTDRASVRQRRFHDSRPGNGSVVVQHSDLVIADAAAKSPPSDFRRCS